MPRDAMPRVRACLYTNYFRERNESEMDGRLLLAVGGTAAACLALSNAGARKSLLHMIGIEVEQNERVADAVAASPILCPACISARSRSRTAMAWSQACAQCGEACFFLPEQSAKAYMDRCDTDDDDDDDEPPRARGRRRNKSRKKRKTGSGTGARAQCESVSGGSSLRTQETADEVERHIRTEQGAELDTTQCEPRGLSSMMAQL